MKRLIVVIAGTIGILGAVWLSWGEWKHSPPEAGQSTARKSEAPSQEANRLELDLPRGPLAPAINSETWLNSAPLSPDELRGHVVLVDFWTFDCINCRNTIPYLQSWYAKYRDQGFIIVGVHSPEFSFEHDVANVKQAIQELKITYPVALDNDFHTWNAYRVYAWPTWFIVDKQGAVRFTHIGEGAYPESEQAIRQLLGE